MTPRVTAVYRPHERSDINIFKMTALMIRNAIGARELIWQLYKKDLLAQYKKSFLGYSWILISPLIAIVSWLLLQNTGLLQPGEVGVPYPAYVLVGTSMWGLFTGFLTAGSKTLEVGAALIHQVKFPHEVLLIKQAANELTNFGLVLALNIVLLLAMGVDISWQTVFLPVVLLPLFFLGAGVGLLIGLISVVAIDVNAFVTRTIGLALFITPIIYSSDVDSPLLKTIITWNPLTYLVCSARDIMLFGRLYDVQGFLISSAGSLAVFILCVRLFYLAEHKVVERMI